MPRSSPAKKGYSLPAEWEIHEATWISWPHSGCASFPGSYEKVIPAFVAMAEAIAEAEILRVNVRNPEEESRVRKLLASIPADRVEFFHIPTDEPWCRDHGPLFIRRDTSPRLAALDFGFNAWGFKLSPFEEDFKAARLMAEAVGVPVIDRQNFILEGGSIDTNGAGTLLTTESCLLNPNRNPDLTRQQIEDRLKESLGVQNILWLGDGIEGDDTDGHVDDIARFVNADTIVAAIEEDRDDPNYEPLQKNLERIKSMTLADGSPVHIHTLPMPRRIMREGLRLPASYANFYITNSSVLMPAFGETNDSWAASILRELFPARRIIPIDCRELIWGLGAFHCLTQQQPAVAG
jgi:agmatine deiminase